MQKRKRLALLSLLLMVSVGSAVVAQASGVLQSLPYKVEEEAIPLELDIQDALTFFTLTSEEREKVTDIVLMDSQVQELLEGADNYTLQVPDFDIKENFFDLEEIDNEGHGISGCWIVIVPNEDVGQVTIKINNDYGEEFGVQTVTVAVDLVNEEVTKIEVNPEIRKPKVHEGILYPTELLESELVRHPYGYDGVIVTVSGKVSLLGEVWGYLFMLDEKITVFYRHEEANVDVSDIENGDSVTVTGKFSSPDTLYALEIKKN